MDNSEWDQRFFEMIVILSNHFPQWTQVARYRRERTPKERERTGTPASGVSVFR
jgi:hypothetical protein